MIGGFGMYKQQKWSKEDCKLMLLNETEKLFNKLVRELVNDILNDSPDNGSSSASLPVLHM